MRIAILGTRGIPARYGGFETLAEELSARLAARGPRRDGLHAHPLRGAADCTTHRGARIRVLPTVPTKYFDTVAHGRLSASTPPSSASTPSSSATRSTPRSLRTHHERLIAKFDAPRGVLVRGRRPLVRGRRWRRCASVVDFMPTGRSPRQHRYDASERHRSRRPAPSPPTASRFSKSRQRNHPVPQQSPPRPYQSLGVSAQLDPVPEKGGRHQTGRFSRTDPHGQVIKFTASCL